MAALLLIVIFGAIAAACGRAILDRMNLPLLPFLERTAYSAALGLGIAAFGVYALGLAGLLSFWPVTCWWLLLAGVGWGGLRGYARDCRAWRDARQQNKLHSGERAVARQSTFGIERGLIVACGLILIVFGGIAVVACFRPPGPLEWDALSYHLADPKLFLLQHRISLLPTEHHSNFPFTMEMLFTVGLLYNGFALANLFHLLVAALTLAGIIGFCSRLLHPVVGWLAAVIYFTTPMVLWESSVAYIDVGLAFYATLSACAAVSAVEGRRGEEERQRVDSSFILLAALLMGFALGIKYLALVPFGLTAVLLLWWRVPVRQVALFVAVALAVGSPWYVKNAVMLRNPVYPFVTKVFPHSRYWSADRAASYQTEQDKFGTKPLSPDARSKILNMMQSPWHLLTRPNPQLLLTHPELKSNVLYCNPGEFNFAAIFGGLYAALVFPLAFVRKTSPVIRFLLWLGVGQMLAWFGLSQVGRYLVQIMPLFAIVGAYTAWQLLSPAISAAYRETRPGVSNRLRLMALPGTLGIAAVFGQAGYVLLSICTLPMNAGAQERLQMAAVGQMPSNVSVPVLLANLGQPEAWDADLRRHFDAFKCIEWINRNTPASAKIALVDETRGYYLDRAYLWANQQHSSYIPYETLQNGAELSDWFAAQGVQYALVNLNLAAQNNGATRDPDFLRGPNMQEEAALRKWYVDSLTNNSAGDRGHQLMGDAIRRGLWPAEFAANGCIVLRIKTTVQATSAHTDPTTNQNNKGGGE